MVAEISHEWRNINFHCSFLELDLKVSFITLKSGLTTGIVASVGQGIMPLLFFFMETGGYLAQAVRVAV